MPSIDVTLKRIGFKAGRPEQPGAVAEIVLICEEPDQVLSLVPHISQRLEISAEPAQPELPFGETVANGTVPSAGRRRRGTRANVLEHE